MKSDFFNKKAIEYGITPLPKETSLAMAYVPYQTPENSEMYGTEKAMDAGTMFQKLDKPFDSGEIESESEKND